MGLCFVPHDPVGVEGDSCVGRTHVHFCGHGTGLSFHASHSSFRQQLLCCCLLTVGACLVILPLDDAGPVDYFSVSLEVAEGGRPALLDLPFLQVFLCELVPHVEPQGGMRSHIAPSKLHTVGHPHVNVPNQGGCQTTSLAKAASIQMVSHVVLPKLEEHSHPGPHRWAVHSNILVVGTRRNQWQFPPYGHRRLDEFKSVKPSGHQRHREGLLELPVLGAPFNCGQYLGCKLLSLVPNLPTGI